MNCKDDDDLYAVMQSSANVMLGSHNGEGETKYYIGSTGCDMCTVKICV